MGEKETRSLVCPPASCHCVLTAVLMLEKKPLRSKRPHHLPAPRLVGAVECRSYCWDVPKGLTADEYSGRPSLSG